MSSNQYSELKNKLQGDLFTDEAWKILYATDASVYREKPTAVARPKSEDDIRNLILFAKENKLSIIPRAGGTSLAGQVVGKGIVVDISRYMNQVIEFNPAERWIKVQPGIVLAELNKFLNPHGLQFGPETSTDTRCCIGGMLGNNSCGLHSIIYGSVRNHILEVETFLSDGSKVIFGSLNETEFKDKCQGDPDKLETRIYQNLYDILSDKENQALIRQEYPDPEVTRRNNGYAIDVLLESSPFTSGGPNFNMAKLLAGSEGTLAFTTSIKLNLIPLPPQHRALMCAHFKSLEESIQANLVALKFNPGAIELMDDKIIECTKGNIEQQKNRFFLQGDPGALLMIEFAREDPEELKSILINLENSLREKGLGYHYPILHGNQISSAWNLRKAGLGLLSNIPGDRRGVPGIEDAAVAPRFLPEYIRDLKLLLAKYGLDSIYYAHIATGEIHIRPMLNLKDSEDIDTYHSLTNDVAHLVKKYKGSFSGEHGDGRLRGEFIPLMLGDKIYQLLKELKQVWDPEGIMNPGKITDCPPMNETLRYDRGQVTREFKTHFNFSSQHGIMRSIENCNGSGDCRKPLIIGGTM
ncbi:MAG: FAD-binding oxidoreductase, partial [Bacteroidota bacterium]|nr:FAD-binding oxidoreductase [Bacteroidota bacterium]